MKKLISFKGTINKGDLVAFEGDMTKIMKYPDDLIHLKWSDKKVKWCYCSYDIQIGDIVRHEQFLHTEYTVTENNINSEFMKHCFKITGECI